MSTRVESVPDAPRTAPDPGRHPALRIGPRTPAGFALCAALLEHPVPQTGATGVLAPTAAATTSEHVGQGIYCGLHALLPEGVRGDVALHPVAVASPGARVAADVLRGRRWTG